MPALRLILADQLTRDIASLRDVEDGDVLLLAEVREEANYVRHHKQKIAFLFAAMRNFAAELEAAGTTVRYVRYDDETNAGSLREEVRRALNGGDFDRIVVTQCGEWRLAEDMKGWARAFNTPVDILEDDRFICSLDEFAAWAEGRKSLRMEYFYREMRRKTGLLMTSDGGPEGGEWNFDAENRKTPPKGWTPPTAYAARVDQTTREVIALVGEVFPDHPGDLDAETFRYG
ncbi:MAG: cryptochrome/photolyase family protein, partial [Pseudomonadota bacterium]